ncbi:hypothetical protein DFH09DRAFT_1309766 [Mycena vulgaris]|nr:hypothetical protein DFH09DRAFT_1309766 [Mycena vulgaris]
MTISADPCSPSSHSTPTVPLFSIPTDRVLPRLAPSFLARALDRLRPRPSLIQSSSSLLDTPRPRLPPSPRFNPYLLPPPPLLPSLLFLVPCLPAAVLPALLVSRRVHSPPFLPASLVLHCPLPAAVFPSAVPYCLPHLPPSRHLPLPL